MEFSLICHPSSPVPPIDDIHVDVSRTEGVGLMMRYRITGDIGSILMPPLMAPERADELWKTTCFEAFLKIAGNLHYAEFNFSPSARWASYIFDNYREGRQDLASTSLPRIDIQAGSDSFELRATVGVVGNADGWRTTDLLLGLSAVIETRDRQKSYWALAHPPGAPDFHHGDCFAGILRAPEAA